MGDRLTPDVLIHRGSIGAPPKGWRQVGACCHAAETGLRLEVPGVAVFLVRADRITVMPLEGGDEDAIRLYLLGNVLGALMHLRGKLVLHGCVLRYGEIVFALCGSSGAGKSTLSASLVKQGCQLVSDELCVLDRNGMVVCGYPEIKLWQDAAGVLGIDIASLRPVRASVKKFAWRDAPFVERVAQPVSTLFCLSRDEDNRIDGLETVSGVDKFQALKSQVYRPAYVDGLGREADNFRLLTTLLNQADVVLLPGDKGSFEAETLTRKSQQVLARLSRSSVDRSRQ